MDGASVNDGEDCERDGGCEERAGAGRRHGSRQPHSSTATRSRSPADTSPVPQLTVNARKVSDNSVGNER